MLAALASSPATKALDPDPFPRHSLRHAVYAALLHFGFETAQELNAALIAYLSQVTEKVIREEVHKETGEAEEVDEPTRIGR